MTYWLCIGDAIEQMRRLRDQSIHCVVTSPPYFGLRSYLPDGHPDKAREIGLEDTPDAFVARLVEVFREVRRVLRDDGTVWLNLGDSYAAQRGGTHMPAQTVAGGIGGKGDDAAFRGMGGEDRGPAHRNAAKIGLKHKDLIGIPWRVAFALQADGWYLRQDIIWHKPNPMPESVTDRCTKAHEYLFMLSKGPRYYFDAEAIKEPGVIPAGTKGAKGSAARQAEKGVNARPPEYKVYDGMRNRRSVWTVATKPYSGAHFATFPPDLIEPCILAGCPAQCCAACGAPVERVVERAPMVIARSDRTHEKGHTRSSGTMLAPASSRTVGWRPTCSCNTGTVAGIVLDPFGGSGTVAGVALKHGRNAVLIDLNPSSAELVPARVSAIAGLPQQEAAE